MIFAFITLVGLVSGILAIYDFIRVRHDPGSAPRLAVACIIVFTVITIGSIVFANALSPSQNTNSASASNQSAPTNTSDTEPDNIVQNTPDPSPTPDPDPTPIPILTPTSIVENTPDLPTQPAQDTPTPLPTPDNSPLPNLSKLYIGSVWEASTHNETYQVSLSVDQQDQSGNVSITYIYNTSGSSTSYQCTGKMTHPTPQDGTVIRADIVLECTESAPSTVEQFELRGQLDNSGGIVFSEYSGGVNTKTISVSEMNS